MIDKNHLIQTFLLFIFLLLFPSTIRCQCETNWFGKNCSQINICNNNKNNNNSSLCPNGFICKTTDENQECLATGTFEGNSSHLIGRLNSSLISKEISFRLRAHLQSTHLLTIKNLVNLNSFSLYLSKENLIYRDSNLTNDLIIKLNNQTYEQWTTFHFQWLENSTLIFNDIYQYKINFTFEEIIEINIGNGFRGCLEYVLIGKNFYVPFYNDSLIENDTRRNKIHIESIKNIQINNCTFNNTCQNLRCQHGQCMNDFDRGICLCHYGWEGDYCQINIDECQRGNNCSKEHSICEDHIDGYYTCKCHQGFTGEFCETNIDECLSSPCAHGANCTDLINGYVCNCTNNYISSNCSISLNDTCFGRLNPCQNNGTCLLKSANLYVDNPQTECQCQNGYNGKWCENDLCLKLNCKNNGTCQRFEQAKCLCPEQWYGDQCQYDVDECIKTKDICLNNGTCLNYPGTYLCQCHENYYGKNCERKNICLEYSPCFNKGQCRPNGEHYHCECSSNFTGSHCELMTCESVPCRHNGRCISDSERGFSCDCIGTGYEDEVCSTKINECLSNPCRNNASCIDQIGGYICACSSNFTGSHCELVTCESAPCRHNGTCISDNERGFSCDCIGTGYEDVVCSTEINECLSNPCRNNASCIDQIGGYLCACSKSFAGVQCENKKFLALHGFSYHYVIWPGVALLLLLVIILLTVIIGRIRESRRSRGTYRPALNENGQSSRVEFSMILKPPPEERLI